MIHLIGYTRNKIPVYVDLIRSAAATHIARQPHLLTLAAGVLQRTRLKGAIVELEHDMGHVIGYDSVVETTATDTVFYAQLIKDTAYTRFVKHGEPRATSYVTLLLQAQQGSDQYNLNNLWVGPSRPAIPGTAEETVASRAYWEKHAFVFDKQPIRGHSITKVCPF